MFTTNYTVQDIKPGCLVKMSHRFESDEGKIYLLIKHYIDPVYKQLVNSCGGSPYYVIKDIKTGYQQSLYISPNWFELLKEE